MADGPRAFTLRAGGLVARCTDQGASLMALEAPDREGRMGPVVLGFDDPAAYAGPHPCFGATVGRVANRIAHARFALDGESFALPANDGSHHLHGGPDGFDRRRFDAEPFREAGADGVRFRLESPDGDQGYPGALALEVTLRLTDVAELRIDFAARCDRPTLVAPSHHAYFHLGDGGASPVLDHELAVFAEHSTPMDDAGIPDGTRAPVAGTAFDFRVPRRLGERIDAVVASRGGYDHNWQIDGETGRLRPAARLHDPASGRTMTVETTFPALQVYTGNGLDGRLAGHGGTRYARHSAVCLEAQFVPDAVNHAAFETPRLAPGERFEHTTVYRFEITR